MVTTALDYIAGTLRFTPYSVLHEIMDTAPFLLDKDTGKLEEILDGDAFIMSKKEALGAMDFLQDFKVGYASDGNGNYVKFPVTTAENKLTFKEKHPTINKGICILAAIFTVGATAALSGCTEDTNERYIEGIVRDEQFHNPQNNTRADDWHEIHVANPETMTDKHIEFWQPYWEYWQKENVTDVDDRINVGDYVKVLVKERGNKLLAKEILEHIPEE